MPTNYVNFKGAADFRMRLICATLGSRALRCVPAAPRRHRPSVARQSRTSDEKAPRRRRRRYLTVARSLPATPRRIDDIRVNDQNPGVRDYEASLLRLLDKLTNGMKVEINETGTTLKYKPGIVTGGRRISHDCGTARAIGYFLEVVIPICLFAKKPVDLTLTGITNDETDVSVDTIRTVTLPMIKRQFGVDDGLALTIVKRGVAPGGGGEINIKLPIAKELKNVDWTDEGMVKRVRGVAFTLRVSPQTGNRLVDASRGVLNDFLPDVYIFTDHHPGDAKNGQRNKTSPGFGLSLVAETTSGCLLSVDCASTSGSAAREAGHSIFQPVDENSGSSSDEDSDDYSQESGSDDSEEEEEDDVGSDEDEEMEEEDDDEEKDEEEMDSDEDDPAAAEEAERERRREEKEKRREHRVEFQARMERAKGGVMVPEDLGKTITEALVAEIARGGVCDSTHQPLVLLLMAIGPDMLTKARLGPLTPRAIQTLRIIRAVLGVTFNLEEQPQTGTVMCMTVGAGIKNIARRAT